jgi:hypothetical protein
LNATYQIVRNILAALVAPNGNLEIDRSHALIVYDARNPAFAHGGAGRQALDTVIGALRYPRVLRIVSWQTIIASVATEPALGWLSEGLAAKYGLVLA